MFGQLGLYSYNNNLEIYNCLQIKFVQEQYLRVLRKGENMSRTRNCSCRFEKIRFVSSQVLLASTHFYTRYTRTMSRSSAFHCVQDTAAVKEMVETDETLLYATFDEVIGSGHLTNRTPHSNHAIQLLVMHTAIHTFVLHDPHRVLRTHAHTHKRTWCTPRTRTQHSHAAIV